MMQNKTWSAFLKDNQEQTHKNYERKKILDATGIWTQNIMLQDKTDSH